MVVRTDDRDRRPDHEFEEKSYIPDSIRSEPYRVLLQGNEVKLDAIEDLDEIMKNALERSAEFEESEKRRRQISHLAPQLIEESGRIHVVIPDTILRTDDPRSILLAVLCLFNEVIVSKFECDDFVFSELTMPEEKRIWGIISFLRSLLEGKANAPFKLTRVKKDVDLGFNIGRAAVVKSHFERNNLMKYLRRNQFFFGNSEDEEERKSIPYGLHVIDSAFANCAFGDELSRLTKKLLFRVDATNFINREIIESFRIPFREFLKKYEKPIVSTKGRRSKVVGYRKPKKPNRSPVLTKSENQEVSQILDIYWSTLEVIKDDWETCNIGELPFYASSISAMIDHRWKLIQNYAKMTTSRLESLRAYHDWDTSIKKKDVTRIDVESYIEQSDAAAELQKLVLLLIHKDDLTAVISHRLQKIKDINHPEVNLFEMYQAELKNIVNPLDEEKQIRVDLSPDYEILEFNSNWRKMQRITTLHQHTVFTKRKIEEYRFVSYRIGPIARAHWEGCRQILEFMKAIRNQVNITPTLRRYAKVMAGIPLDLWDMSQDSEFIRECESVCSVNRNTYINKFYEDIRNSMH